MAFGLPANAATGQPAAKQATPMQLPAGARQNDLSGRVPSNQVYAQAFNQASEQVGNPNRATSYTMPGTRTSRSLNMATGQYSEPQTQQSFGGNMAYNAIDDRPSPIQSKATGIDGSAMPWKDALSQKEAFTGGLVERLGQYQSGAQTGRPDINPRQILNQANERLADGSFVNPFRNPVAPALSQARPQPATQSNTAMQNSDVQRAMGNANQYMQGNFQNPFGDSQQSNNPMPSWDQHSYNPQSRRADMRTPAVSKAAPAGEFPWLNDRSLNRPRVSGEAGRRTAVIGGDMVISEAQMGAGAFDKMLAEESTKYGPPIQAPGDWKASLQPSWDDVNPATSAAVRERASRGDDRGYSGILPSRAEGSQLGPQPPRAASNGPGSAQPIEPPSQGTPYNPQAAVQGFPDAPPAPGPRDVAQARKGKEPRQPARAGSPRRKVPPANVTYVPVSRRGSAARFGGMRKNGG